MAGTGKLVVKEKDLKKQDENALVDDDLDVFTQTFRVAVLAIWCGAYL